jgi:hypothetical protein
LRKRDIELDLFGQVPINRLELKRKLKSDGDLTVNRAIKEIIAEKLTGTFTLSPKYKRQRRFSSPQETINKETLQDYLKICSSRKAYRFFLAKVRSEVKRIRKGATAHDKRIIRLRNIGHYEQEAYAVIAQLTKSTKVQDRKMAKLAERKGEIYKAKRKRVTVEHVRLFKRAEVDTTLIPWHLATNTARFLAKKIGIYREPKQQISTFIYTQEALDESIKLPLAS